MTLAKFGMVTMTHVTKRAFQNGVAHTILRLVANVMLVLLNTV
jgi:hypothetical protein